MLDLKHLSVAVLLLPLIAAVLSGVLGKKLGKQNTHRVCILAVGLSCILSTLILVKLDGSKHDALNFNAYTWAESGGIRFQIGFLLDRLTAVMMFVVTFVSLMVHLYTVGYMSKDAGYQRFFSYISLFTFGMLMLVMSNNFLQLFFGWEMVGLVSYLLIGFWFQKESAIVANLKAFLVNRVGDFGFLMGIAALAHVFGTLDYATVFGRLEDVVLQSPFITFMCIAFFIGAMGKSAQIPLHVWLPDSMEGPTPISALIHAATMVTAGVFMVARCSPLFEYSEIALTLVLMIGALTCLLMGMVAVVQDDIKKIIAYSTLSQLGYMMMAMGVSAYPVGIFHLITHAFFKALLFLGAGSIILALHHEQNIWKMGDLKKYMPITYFTMLIGSLALIGFPFFSGFYSKDFIIEAVKVSKLPGASFAYWVALVSVFITALYTFRLFFVVFHTPSKMADDMRAHLRESPFVMVAPLLLLSVFSVISGGVIVERLLQGYLEDAITIHANHISFATLQEGFIGAYEMGVHGMKGLPFGLAMSGVLIAWVSYVRFPRIASILKNKLRVVNKILVNQYGFDKLYECLFCRGIQRIGYTVWQKADVALIDEAGVNGIAHTVGRLSRLSRRLQSGYLYQYAFGMVLGVLLLCSWLLISGV